MMWIENRRGESIPSCLYYDGWQTDKDHYKQTPLMFWIGRRQCEPIP